MSITIKCPSCGLLLSAPDNSEGQHAECVCGFKFYIPDLDKFSIMSKQATEEKKTDYKKSSQTISRMIEQKQKSAFTSSGTVDDELREILYLQKSGNVEEAEKKLKGLLFMRELRSYYQVEKTRREWELNVTLLHVYDKARVFYERKKEYYDAAIYAGMTIFSRGINLNLLPYFTWKDIEVKYYSALEKNLKRIGKAGSFSELRSTIERFLPNAKNADQRDELLSTLRSLLEK